MFLKNHKGLLPWIYGILAALFFSLGMVLLEERNRRQQEGMIETTTIRFQKEETEIGTEILFTNKTDSDISILFPSVLLFGGIIFSVFFIFIMRQECSYLGTETELFLLSFCVIRIWKSFSFGFLWLLFFLVLVSLRGIWAWIWKGFPLEWGIGHRLGKWLIESSGKQSYYLLFQFGYSVLLLLLGLGIFWLKSTYNWIFLMDCLVSEILVVSNFITLTSNMDHLSKQIKNLHQGNSISVQTGVFADEEEQLMDFYRQRDEAIATAVTSERFKVELISNVSHDLRTPLTAILGYGELLEAESLSLEGKKQLAELNKKAGYMRDLVDSLFELTKVSSGVVKCEKKQIDLIRLLEQTIGLFDDQLKENGLFVRRHYKMESLPIITDGARIHQVFANLIGNAIKYSLQGTRIHLDVKESEKEVIIRVTNIASYEMDFDATEILQRFVRGDKARTTKGSGLGLAIAQTYTESVGGTFEVQIDAEQFHAIVKLPNLERKN